MFYNWLRWPKFSFWILPIMKRREVFIMKRFGPQNIQECVLMFFYQESLQRGKGCS